MSLTTQLPETRNSPNFVDQADLHLHAPTTSETLKPTLSQVPWRVIQTLVWALGALLFLALNFFPEIGLHMFWNVLIPIAPALFAFAPGLWRNICPLGSTALFPRHLGLSHRWKLTLEWQARLGFFGVLLLLLIIPLRHVTFNMSGPATALLLAVIACGAFILGLLFEWKSAWCSGTCPIYPVEKLYGSNPIDTFSNAHCYPCERCVSPCPDSTRTPYLFTFHRNFLRNLTVLIMVGAFPGYIWGWFHVPDYLEGQGWWHLDIVYGYPLLGGAVTLIAFLVMRSLVPPRHYLVLIRAFAAAAITCYYWYRLPALIGFGLFPGNGMLMDLSSTVPSWFESASKVTTTFAFAWWFFGRKTGKQTWTIRPQFSERVCNH